MLKERVNKYLLISIFLLYISVLVIFNITSKNKAFSDSENRSLSQFPSFSFKKLTDGKFTKGYEDYIKDQFAFRDSWIYLNSDVQVLFGKKELNGVFIASDNSLMQDFKKPEISKLTNTISKINLFANNNKNIKTYFLLIPNAIKIQENKLPRNTFVYDQLFYCDMVKNELNKSIRFIDIFDTLKSKQNEYIYYKTDHHFTQKGAFYTYEETAKALGIKPFEESDFDIKRVSDNFYGTLYSKAGYNKIDPDSLDIYTPKNKIEYTVSFDNDNKTFESVYFFDDLNKKDKYSIFFDGNHPLVTIKSNVKNDKKLLVVKDSYANSLVPFLINHYSEITMIDLRYYNDNLSDIIKNKNLTDTLILYNANTFFEDAYIKNIAD